MRMPRSNRSLPNPSEKKTLALMARNVSRVYDVDKGEISDGDSSASLEEISADDFRQDGTRSRSRGWDDGMMGYSVASSFGPTLYSFAWAQAVQNKPLGLEMKPVMDADGETGKGGSDEAIVLDSSEDSAGQMEKEEGELEEGEIDLDSEAGAVEIINLASDEAEDELILLKSETKETEDKKEADMEDLDRRVSEILEELDTITSEEAEASLEGVCSRLLKSFASLKTMFSESHVPLDAFVQHAFTRIQTLHSVFCSGNLKKTKQNMDLLLRLLIHIKNQYSILLSQEQVTEIDSMAQSLVSNDLSKEKVTQNASSANGSDSANQLERRATSSSAAFSEKSDLDLRETHLSGSHSGRSYLSKFDSPFSRSRVEFSPLLDLHADYDEGSLPSPTRENAPVMPLPVLKPIGFGVSALSHPTVFKNEKDEEATLHSYVNNDAFKAVSSYQQKYVRTSILPLYQLPSPTPSEDGSYEDDKHDEVSSSFVIGNAKSVKPACSLRSGSSFTPVDVLTGLQSAPNKLPVPLNSLQNQAVKAKSRDPRLRFMNHNSSVSSDQNVSRNGHVEGQSNFKKLKAADDSMLDNHSLKKQRHSSIVPTDISTLVQPGTAVATADTRLDSNGTSTVVNLGNEQNPTIPSIPSVSLPSLLMDMDINPVMLMELFNMKQHRLEEPQQKSGSSAGVKSQVKSSNVLPGSISSVNGVTLKPIEIARNPSSKSQIPSQNSSLNTKNDAGKLRMKPRDPRRFLHDNAVQKIEALIPEQNKVKNLKNVSDTSQPIPGTANKPDGRLIIESNDSKVINSSTCAKEASFQGTNPWGDVNHLLNGYDDEQKAAIQKERTRRIAEQNKMFAARKLCLVLDLDHTLLNSAKFGEVELVHEEVLRKKEEQDRELPQRHLFRFQHMAMWTKLRPGVWNFLEKASKIFEMHLYTMGNKLYATEMAKVLDPTGALFAGRVISRGDDGEPFDGDERVPKSKDLEGVLGMESAVVIIDDSIRVWPHNRHNLILVERYTYFPCSRRQFGLLGPSLLEIDHDERPEDGTLASCLSVIGKIHHIFFSQNCLNDVDVRHILATEQRKILAGCRVVFSRIFPVGEANPHLHPLWQSAEQFGAVCTNQIDEQVTHVVANSLGTDKVNWALSTGRFVVHPGWVEASALLYRRANENDFAVKL